MTYEAVRIAAAGVTLAGDRWSGAGVTIALLHAGVCDRRCWREVTAHGASATDAFDLVIPSPPGDRAPPPSMIEPGQPCVTISGSASSCRERTWMKWMSSPSISVTNCGRALSFASHGRQS